MDYKLRIEQLTLSGNDLTLTVSGVITDPNITPNALPRPKLVLFFNNGKENRRLPLVIQDINYIGEQCLFSGHYTYKLNLIYWSTRGEPLPSSLTFNLSYGNFYEEGAVFEVTPAEVSEADPCFICELKENEIIFTPVAARKKSRLVTAVKSVLHYIFYFLTFLIAMCLLPWFLLEALLSFAGITELDSHVKTEVPLRRIIGHVNQRMARLTTKKLTFGKLYKGTIIALYSIFKLLPVKDNRITFISMRRTDLSGNFAFVYDQMKDRKDLDIKFILTYSNNAGMPPLKMVQFCYSCAVSKVIVLDEYTPQIHYIDLKPQTKLIQLWHACGAFKTFGFTRLGKPAGSPQTTRMHRSYDYVTVSSTYCKKCHSEGFGISDEKVEPTGIARTDVFFDQDYKQRVTEEFFSQYPKLKGKKIILFAPTFRGNVKETAYYPVEAFDVKKVYEAIGDEYAVIIKHHPFVTQQQPIPPQYSDVIIDLSENSELNDLLFVTDLIITDYSSLIFEAALLKIPMLFYVFDLNDYIKSRDFYFDLRLNSPGKLVYSSEELITAIQNEDYEPERMDAFANMFFDNFDGKSAKRVVELIEKARTE